MSERDSNGYMVLFIWGVFFAFGIYLFQFGAYKQIKEISKNAEISEERFGFTGNYFYDFLETIGEAGQAVYFNFLLLDYINLLLLGLALFVTIRYFLNKLHARKLLYILLIFPVIFILFDFLENSLIIYLIYKLPSKFFTLAKLASDLTKLKIIFFSLSVVSLVLVGIVLLLKKLSQKLREKKF